MPRPRSAHLASIEQQLRLSLLRQRHTPGARFYSNRALAQAFGISQQSAHDLLHRLCGEGLLVRRASSGTYVPCSFHSAPTTALLVFNVRAQRPESFGHYLLQQLSTALREQNLPHRIQFHEPGEPWTNDPSCFPIFWEAGDQLFQSWKQGAYGLILHREPPLGLAASWLDSIQVDDRSGGVMAGEILRDTFRIPKPPAIVAGPACDSRSQHRVSGMQSIFPDALIFFSGGWFSSHGEAIASDVLACSPGGIFCCNDRLAEGVVRAAKKIAIQLPALIGFDNAPIAEELYLNSIAIPWREMVDTALQIIKSRIRGEQLTAGQRILTPRPVLRNFQ